MRFISRLISVSVLLALSLTLSACDGTPQPAPQKTPAATASAAANPVPASRAPNSPQVQEALDYLRSPERVSQFEQLLPKAGIKIAQALQAGRFGTVKRYDGNKQPLQPGEVGWGGVSSQNNNQFAWVHWQANGSIDFSKPINKIAINNANGNPGTAVMMFAPTSDDPADTIGSYWTVFKAVGGETEITGLENIMSPHLATTTTPGMYYSPASLDELKQLDIEAFDQLRANVVSWFGPDWDK